MAKLAKPKKPEPIEIPAIMILCWNERELINLSKSIDKKEVILSPCGEETIKTIHEHLMKNHFIETENGYMHISEVLKPLKP